MAVGIDTEAIKNATPEDAKAKGIEKFGKLILNAGLKFANQITPRVIKEIESRFPEGECPPKEEVEKALALRDNIVDQANKISSSLDSFSKIVLGVSNFVTITLAIVKGIKTAKSILSSISTGLSVFPIPNPFVNQVLGALNSVVGILDEIAQNTTFDTLGKQRLVPLKAGLDGAAISISLANTYITDFVDQISKLDANITKCDPSAILTPLDPQLLLTAELQKQASFSSNQVGYKGFIIEIEEVPFSPTVNRKKAVGLNQDQIKLIETPLSFATNDNILKEELKFIIDRDNLKAY